MNTAHYYILGILAAIDILSLFSLANSIKAIVNNKNKKGNY